MNIENKVVLITGTKRIGSAVGMILASKGADVVLTFNRSREEAETTAGKIRQLGRKAMALPADVSVASDVYQLVDRVNRELGSVNILSQHGVQSIAPGRSKKLRKRTGTPT